MKQNYFYSNDDYLFHTPCLIYIFLFIYSNKLMSAKLFRFSRVFFRQKLFKYETNAFEENLNSY